MHPRKLGATEACPNPEATIIRVNAGSGYGCTYTPKQIKPEDNPPDKKKEETPLMPKLMVWISASLLAAAWIAPVMAGTNDATDGKTPATTTANGAAQPAAAANPNLTPTGSADVTALLGVLVMKGVVAPSEANAIRNAAPKAEFQLLIETLIRKGVVNAADFSTVAPATTAAVPSAAPPQAAPPTPAAPSPAPLAVEAARKPVRPPRRKRHPDPRLRRQWPRCVLCPLIRR